MRHKLIIGCLLGLVVLMAACNPSPELPTPTPPDKEARLEERIAELERKISELSDTPKTDSEREEIISFTRQALELEAKRNEFMRYLIGLRRRFPAQMQRGIIETYFSSGVPPGSTWLCEVRGDPPSGFEGMASLLNKLLMLDCPQSMQPVKDTLIYIYHSEIGQAQLQSQIRELQRELQSQIRELHPETLWRGGSIQELVYLEVTWDNLDHWRQKAQHGHFFYSRMVKSIWFSLQESRRDIYVRWAEILQEHGIDPRDFR